MHLWVTQRDPLRERYVPNWKIVLCLDRSRNDKVGRERRRKRCEGCGYLPKEISLYLLTLNERMTIFNRKGVYGIFV